MPEAQEYDIAIIGGGPGGYVAALRASLLGARVALIEKDRVGGTCLNRGCIPTKALLQSAEVLAEARRAGEFGVVVEGARADFKAMMARKQKVVDTLVGGVEQLLKAGQVALFRGPGRLRSPRQVQVNQEPVTAKALIIASGSVPARLPIPGLDLPGVLTSNEVLELQEVPPRLVIIGGGVISMEFASLFSLLGSRVTVLEMLPQILPPVDEELARRFQQLMKAQGMEITTSARVTEVRPQDSALEVRFATEKGEGAAAGDKVLVATGRWPYTEGLGLEGLGIKMERRAIAVDGRMATSIPGVYAIGDVVGGIMLAHVASHQGEVAVANALGRNKEADYSAVPNCIYTLPELAGVGLTEKEAKERELPYKVSRFPFSALGRAHTLGQTQGQVKLLCHPETGKVLGVHILGPRATDLIAEAALALRLGATARDIAETIHAHPTLPEALWEAALGQLEGSIHFRRLALT